MSQIPLLQCLFCQHLNPADAVFCDACGGQMDLQPCDRCDAVDSRTATNCYKCGAEFSPPAAPGADFPPTSAATVDKKSPSPTSIEAGVAGAGAAHLHQGLTDPHPESQPADEVLSPETPDTATRPGRSPTVAILALLFLLVAAAVSVYLYRGQPAQPARAQGQQQAASDVSSGPAPPTAAAGADVALKPGGTVQKTAAGANPPGKTPPLAPSGADAAQAARPMPATDAETKTLRDLPVVEKCPPAVATLGLCNPDTQQEKP